MAETRIRGNKTRVPGGEFWIARHPESKVLIKALSFDSLVKAIKVHCDANNYPIPVDFEDKVESWVCEQMPQECEQMVAGKPLRPHHLSMSDVVRGSRVLLAFKLQGSPLVSQEEAERRAWICANCQFNAPFSKPCGGICGELKEIMAKVLGGKSVKNHDQLHACQICHCLAGVHIWFPLNIMAVGLTDTMKQQFNAVTHCWKKV